MFLLPGGLLQAQNQNESFRYPCHPHCRWHHRFGCNVTTGNVMKPASTDSDSHASADAGYRHRDRQTDELAATSNSVSPIDSPDQASNRRLRRPTLIGNTHQGQLDKDGAAASAAAEQTSRQNTFNGQLDKDGAATLQPPGRQPSEHV